MRVLQVTNVVSPHQMPLARCLASRVGSDNFRFAATEVPLVMRTKLGWNAQELEPWILHAGESGDDRHQFDRWWSEADVVIAGYRNVSRLAERVRRGKLTFYMSERWWKPPLGMARLLHPRFAWMAYQFRQLEESTCFHYLPIGRYAAADMRRIAAFRERMWNWGYFTALPDPLPAPCERGNAFRVLWAGRMLNWKRVDTLVRAFAALVRQMPKGRLTLVGDGPCENGLRQLVQRLAVSDNVEFRSCMPVAQVRDEMRKSHVYVLPSDGGEGWGAVLNEAMSEGCAVVASKSAGSAKTIVQHGENGFLFAPGDHKRLSELLTILCTDEPLRHRLAEAGQSTIVNHWSPEAAAERFLAVSDACLSNQSTPIFSNGVMSPA